MAGDAQAGEFATSRTVPEQNGRVTKASARVSSDVLSARREKLETCYACRSFCANKTALWKHVRDEHGADRRLVCAMPGCGKRFSGPCTSVAHMVHHKETDDVRPLTCELCGRLSGNPGDFWRHMSREHRDAVAAVCSVCRLYTGDEPSSSVGHGSEAGRCSATATGTFSDRTRRDVGCAVCGDRYGNYHEMYWHRMTHGSSTTGHQ